MALDSTQKLTVTKAFQRSYGVPLDASELFDSLDDANAYLSQSKAYAGQMIRVLEDGTYVPYIIQNEYDEEGTTVKNLKLGKVSGSGGDTLDLSNYATKQFVNDKVAALIANAPDALDTLKEIADWISSEETITTYVDADGNEISASAYEALTEEEKAKYTEKTTASLLSKITAAEEAAKAYTDARLGNLGTTTTEGGETVNMTVEQAIAASKLTMYEF